MIKKMEYDIMGKKITGLDGWGSPELGIYFDDGTRLIIKAVAHVDLDSKGNLRAYSTIQISTSKIELKAEETEV